VVMQCNMIMFTAPGELPIPVKYLDNLLTKNNMTGDNVLF